MRSTDLNSGGDGDRKSPEQSFTPPALRGDAAIGGLARGDIAVPSALGAGEYRI
jgi:hypothetical protein